MEGGRLACGAGAAPVLYCVHGARRRGTMGGGGGVWAAALSGGCEIDPFILHNHW